MARGEEVVERMCKSRVLQTLHQLTRPAPDVTVHCTVVIYS